MAFAQNRSQTGGDDARRPGTRRHRYMIASAAAGFTEQKLIDRLNRAGNIAIVRTFAARGMECPPIAGVLASDDGIAALRRMRDDLFIVEPDSRLRAAAFASAWHQHGTDPTWNAQQGPATGPAHGSALGSALGPGTTFALQILGEGGQPVANAEVQLVGEQWATQGLTDGNGQISLSLYGELPETITALRVKPRANWWGFSRQRPQLQADGVNTIVLQPLSPRDEIGWGGRLLRFDQLPAECRGGGIKIALIDSGVATSHPQLASVTHGWASSPTAQWTQDVMGHGTPCAGIISAASRGGNAIRGAAPEAELHVCQLPADAHCSDLLAALDYCLQNNIDIACLGFACERGSGFVEQHLIAAKQRGLALIAAAGNTAGPVQFPACSPHVMAIGAIGQVGCYPPDSLQADWAAASQSLPGGLFVPGFSCRGPELDLCAPGVAVISCQAPDGYAACDGTSFAASYVTALAALVLAHHVDFRRDFARRDPRRVERLFQILKETARPVAHPWLTGAGVPDAACSLGLASPASWSTPWPSALSFEGGLEEMRQAIRQMDRGQFDEAMMPSFEPPRGPAAATRLPLNPFPAVAFPQPGTEAGLQALKSAMNLAGLAGSYPSASWEQFRSR